jgi:hypothetical protein
MSDISNFQLAVIFVASVTIWFCGFHHGKWSGIQKAEKRFALQQKALRAARKRENPRL